MSDTPETVYLCSIVGLAGAGADPQTVESKSTPLAACLAKLGCLLASGVEPRFHELWAVPPEPPESRDWTFDLEGAPIRFSLQPSSAHNWLLRVEEGEAQAFTAIVAHHFARGAGVTRRMSTGTLRPQFKSSNLTIDFGDQTGQT